MIYKIYLSVVFLTVFNCAKPQENTKRLLTNSSNKYWAVVKVNNQTIKKTRNIWLFTNDNKYVTYVLNKKNILQEDFNGDEHYNNTFEVLSSKVILLNSYEHNLEYITKDTLILSNKFYKYTLVEYFKNNGNGSD